ncbi:amidohydrolase family protein [Sphingomonas sp.]|uniref:amidohydrolase family protein n=1 Tax=Sphingomonas sp. TaxID=28214 RepID=UPI0035C7E0C0
MIIDVHGHFTTVPAAVPQWRAAQVAAKGKVAQVPPQPVISDDELRAALEDAQLRTQRERGIDLTIFSPQASAMAHHEADLAANIVWSRLCNDIIARVVGLYPRDFIGVCQLPQAPGEGLDASIAELERCVLELGFVGCNLNPDPSGGHWSGPPLFDRSWYPFYEKMVELNVPAMVHVSSSCNPNFQTTGAHYINGDTTAFMQFLTSNLFRDFPDLKFVIPHGGGAAPYHWGRYRGLAQAMKRPPLAELLLNNVFFDTCVYHHPGAELLAQVVPVKNILFASETFGAVRGIDPETGHHFDDTKRYFDAMDFLSEADRQAIFENNARHVYPRLHKTLLEADA